MTGRFATITVEKIGAVARLTLARPERANALNAAMLGEIGTALDEIEHDAGLRALIVTGAGAAFSSGFDLKEQMERRPVGVESWRAILRKDFDTIMRFWHFRCQPSRRCAGRVLPALANWRWLATSRLPRKTHSSASRSSNSAPALSP
jgi:Enoyl-CoA hydratase/isomerase